MQHTIIFNASLSSLHLDFLYIMCYMVCAKYAQMQVLFMGEKLGSGTGKSRKDAQQQAAENALHSLAGNVTHSSTTWYLLADCKDSLKYNSK